MCKVTDDVTGGGTSWLVNATGGVTSWVVHATDGGTSWVVHSTRGGSIGWPMLQEFSLFGGPCHRRGGALLGGTCHRRRLCLIVHVTGRGPVGLSM